MSTAFSLVMLIGALVLSLQNRGLLDVDHAQALHAARLNRKSTTAIAWLFGPILQVPTWS